MILLLLLLLIPSSYSINTTVDYTKIRERFYCEDHCYFAESEINSKTIEKWLSGDCTPICAVITLNQNSNVSPEKLKSIFRRMDKLRGGIRIQNTNFTDFDFFPTFFSYQYSGIGIVISNNSNLNNIDALYRLYVDLWKGSLIHVTMPPKLDIHGFCRWERVEAMDVECGCEAGTITSETISLYRLCEQVIGKLTITDIKGLTPKVPNVMKLSGSLEVRDTSLKDLSFFKNLEEIVMKSGEELILNIQNNRNMTRLGFWSLKRFTRKNYGSITLNFQNLHPDFCLTVPEMSLFINASVTFLNLEARLCNDRFAIWRSDQPALCFFGNMSKLETYCVYIYGDLLIDSGDERYVGKLVKVTHVFGSVIIRNTSLDNCGFLNRLEKIVSLDKTRPVMQLLSNRNLRNLKLPRATGFVTNGNNTMTINDNNPDFFENLRDCLNLQLATKTNISYNGKHCRSFFNFEPDIEYSESGAEFWNDYGFLDTDFPNFWMNTGNLMIAIFGLIINIFHLIALFQNELRASLTFALMIGIGVLNICYLSTFLVEKVFKWIYDPCDGHPYIRVLIIDVIQLPIQEFTRKTSSVLVFLMASIQSLASQSPKGRVVTALLRPSWAIRFIILVSLPLAYRESRDPIGCRIIKIRDGMDKCGGEIYYRKYEERMSAFSQEFNGYFAISMAILHLLIISVLVEQILNTRKLQRIEEKPESLTGMVTVMAVLYCLSEAFHGLYYSIDYFMKSYYMSLFSTLELHGQSLLWFFLTLNSSLPCFICYCMSNQYRSVVRRLYFRK